MTSPYFIGAIGETVAAADFPANNYLIDESKYSYEGNWAFCRFDGEEIYGARLGFGRGYFDVSDYGVTSPISASFLMLHIELMTRGGAILWQGTGRFTADQVIHSPDEIDLRLPAEGRDIFHVQGWPNMRWQFQSDDGEVEIDLKMELKNATILPDCVMPHNLFSMWLATGPTCGRVRYGEKTTSVTGTAFYDHPRINPRENPVPAQAYYVYMPMHFEDGSVLSGYYAKDVDGNRIDAYSFALYIDSEGNPFWFDNAELSELEFDGDDKPSQWRMRWHSESVTLGTLCRVRPTGIVKSWGNLSMKPSRKDNSNIPLIFDCVLEKETNGETESLSGGGIGEYLPHAGCPQK